MRSIARTSVVLLLLAMLGVSCGVNAPLSNVDGGGREAARVEADKLACWHQAETEAGATHSRTRVMMASSATGMGMPAPGADAFVARDRKIERDAEACMVQRGYTIRPK